MKQQIIRRPKNAQEVADESASYEEFGRNLRDFLHEFAFARKDKKALSPFFASTPLRLDGRFKEGKICDAFLAATVDFLSRINGLRTPEWALAEDLILEQPWFAEDSPEVRAFLLRDTPSAFKDKNIFVFESALNVA